MHDSVHQQYHHHRWEVDGPALGWVVFCEVRKHRLPTQPRFSGVSVYKWILYILYSVNLLIAFKDNTKYYVTLIYKGLSKNQAFSFLVLELANLPECHTHLDFLFIFKCCICNGLTRGKKRCPAMCNATWTKEVQLWRGVYPLFYSGWGEQTRTWVIEFSWRHETYVCAGSENVCSAIAIF